MRGSISSADFTMKARHFWLLALCVGGALLSTVSHADDRHRGNDDWRHRGQYLQRHGDRDDRHDRRRDDRDWDRRDGHRDHDRRRNDWDSRSNWRGDGRGWDGRSGGRYYRPDWHYYNGRYWAPPRYRGRYCDDRRHFHGVHYHVAASDYYDYYYPRYRSYGPRPYGANASVIITLPLF